MREALIALVLFLAPSYHRDASMPLRVDEVRAPALVRQAGELAAMIPAEAGRVFILGNPLILHLAQRGGYWRQNHQWWVAFTAEDQPAYRRMGLWGPSDMRAWLTESRYAVIDDHAWQYFTGRPPYAAAMREMRRRLDGYQTIGRIGAYTVYRRV